MMKSENALLLASRASQLAQSEIPKNPKYTDTVMLEPRGSTEKECFLVHFDKNTLYLRCVYNETFKKQLVGSEQMIETPLATKDFAIEFHDQPIDNIEIIQVEQSNSETNPSIFVLLTNYVDFLLYKIPLLYLQYQVNNQKEIVDFNLAINASEYSIITRNIGFYRDICMISPIINDYIVGFDKKSNELCLINYSDSSHRVFKYKHENQSFSRIIEPEAIFIDRRGIEISRTAGTIKSVEQGKNSIFLLYQEYCAIEIWEYFESPKEGVTLREQNQDAGVNSSFNYLKSLYPEHLIPNGYNTEHSENIISFKQIINKAAKNSEDEFLFVFGIAFKGENNTEYKERPDREMDTSLIKTIPDEVFIENNIFLYSNKRFLTAANVDYCPDIISVAEDQNYLFVGSTRRNIVTTFKFQNSNNKLILETTKIINHPNSGARLTSIVPTPKWLCLVDAQEEVYCYDENNSCQNEVNLYCKSQYNEIHFPNQVKRSESGKEKKQETELKLEKSVHFESEEQKRLVATKIRNIDNYINASLFSPRVESYVREYKQSQFAPKASQTFESVASSLHPDDDLLSSEEILELQEKFKEYYNIYERLRIIEEFLILCMNIEIPDKKIKHLCNELVEHVRSNCDNIRVIESGTTYDFNSSTFLYNEYEFVNSKLDEILRPIMEECAINFSTIDQAKAIYNTKHETTSYLDQMHELLDIELNNINIEESEICEILQQEIEDEGKQNMTLVDVLCCKNEEMMEYFENVAQYSIGGFDAIYDAISSRNISVRTTGVSEIEPNMITTFSQSEIAEELSKATKSSVDAIKQQTTVLLSGQNLAEELPRANDVEELVFPPPGKEYVPRANSKVADTSLLSSPVIASKDQEILEEAARNGDIIEDIEESTYLENKKEGDNVDEVRVTYVIEKGANDPDEGTYKTEVEVETYEESVSDQQADSLEVDDVVEEVPKYSLLQLNLPQRQIISAQDDMATGTQSNEYEEKQDLTISEKIEQIEGITEKRQPQPNELSKREQEQEAEESQNLGPEEVEEETSLIAYEQLNEQMPRAASEEIEPRPSKIECKYPLTVQKRILLLMKTEIARIRNFTKMIESNDQGQRDKAIAQLVHSIRGMSQIKQLQLSEEDVDEMVRFLGKLPMKGSFDKARGINLRNDVIVAEEREINAQNEKESEKKEISKGEKDKQENMEKQKNVKEQEQQENNEISKLKVSDLQPLEQEKSNTHEDGTLTASAFNLQNEKFNVDEHIAAEQIKDNKNLLSNEFEVKDRGNTENAYIETLDTETGELAKAASNSSNSNTIKLESQREPAANNKNNGEQLDNLDSKEEESTNEAIVGENDMESENKEDLNEPNLNNRDTNEADIDLAEPSDAVEFEQDETDKRETHEQDIEKHSEENESSTQLLQETKQEQNEEKVEEVCQSNEMADHNVEQHNSTKQQELPPSGPTDEEEQNKPRVIPESSNSSSFSAAPNENLKFMASQEKLIQMSSTNAEDSLSLNSHQDLHLLNSDAQQQKLMQSVVEEAEHTLEELEQSKLNEVHIVQLLKRTDIDAALSANQLLSTPAAKCMNCCINKAELLEDLKSESNLEYFVDELLEVQKGVNHFFENSLIHERRQESFRHDIMRIREGRIPKNNIIDECIGKTTDSK